MRERVLKIFVMIRKSCRNSFPDCLITAAAWHYRESICFLNPLSKIFLHRSYFALMVFNQLSATFFLLENSMNVVDARFVRKCTRIADRCSANVYASCVGQTALNSKVFLQKQVGKAQNIIPFCTSH